MFRSFLFFTLIVLSDVCVGQILPFENCTDVKYSNLLKGDTVIVGCENAVILNKPSFDRYFTVYENARKNNAQMKDLINTYEKFIEVQDKRIEEQRLEYDMLKQKFDSLTSKAHIVIDTNTRRLSLVNNSLNEVNSNLIDTKNLITKATEDIRKEERRLWWKRVGWGVGGLVIGIPLGIGILAIAQ